MNMHNITRFLLPVAIVALLGMAAYYSLENGAAEVGVFSSNGRIEATDIAIAARIGGRVQELLVNEGDFVEAGQVVGRIDSESLRAQLLQAQAQQNQAVSAVLAAQSAVQQARSQEQAQAAAVRLREAELNAARKRAKRTGTLVREGAVSEQLAEDNDTMVASAEAALGAAKAQLSAAAAAIRTAEAQVAAAEAAQAAAAATVVRVEADVADTVLVAPRAGRIQYRVAETGEIVGSGSRILSLIDLTDVYMTFFLPSALVGRLTLGGAVRLVLAAVPQVRIPAQISYVADVAQFTPKTVETASEREKLMFRVKARINPELLQKHITQVKTGLPGMAWLRLDKQQPWPDSLPPLVNP